jgi:hypothetical protein
LIKQKVAQKSPFLWATSSFQKNYNELPKVTQWKSISHKQSTRWQHLS